MKKYFVRKGFRFSHVKKPSRFKAKKETHMKDQSRRNHLDLTYDIPFKMAFGKQADFVKGFIEAALEIKVETLVFLDKELFSIHPRLKQMKGDVIVCVNDSLLINIEMQKQKQKSDFYRAHIYLNALVFSQIQQGGDYDRYRYIQIFITDYDWKEDDEVVAEARIMERTETGIIYNDLTMTRYIGLNQAKELEKKEVKEFNALEGWIYYLKHRHEEGFRKRIEEIKEKDETIRDLDNSMLDLEDDVSFMTKISIALDEACDRMDMKDAEQAREEARLAKQEAEVEKQKADAAKRKAEAEKRKADAEKRKADAAKQKAEVEKQKADAAKQKAEVEKQKADVAKRKAEAEKQKADAAKQKVEVEIQKRKEYEKIIQYMQQGLSYEEALQKTQS